MTFLSSIFTLFSRISRFIFVARIYTKLYGDSVRYSPYIVNTWCGTCRIRLHMLILHLPLFPYLRFPTITYITTRIKITTCSCRINRQFYRHLLWEHFRHFRLSIQMSSVSNFSAIYKLLLLLLTL